MTIPADPSYVSLVRTATAAICARADFTIDTLDDLRLAVDEACALVMADASSDLRITWRTTGCCVSIEVRAASASGRPVARDTFSWTVLSALVDEVDAGVEDGDVRIELQARGIESVSL